MKRGIKNVIKIVVGIIFALVLGGSLLVCLICGIAPFSGDQALAYFVKAVILALALPILLYGFLMWVFHLIDEIEEQDTYIVELEDRVNMQEETQAEEQDKDTHGYINLEDAPLPQLVSAFASKKGLSKEKRDKLLKYLEEL